MTGKLTMLLGALWVVAFLASMSFYNSARHAYLNQRPTWPEFAISFAALVALSFALDARP
jgi:hypothetical protein